MSILDRYQTYADAFEETYLDDDWSRIEPFFSDDAVLEAGAESVRGREAVIAHLKAGVDAFDRKLDSRTPLFQTPTVDGDTLRVTWSVTYTKEGRPDLQMSGVETAVFESDRIASLRDDLDPGIQEAMSDWMAAHGASL